jgi:hypothetical protein
VNLRRVRVGPSTEQWTILGADGTAASFDEVVTQWRTCEAFRAEWLDAFRAVPFDAYAWECRPVTRATLGRAFECVIVDSPMLSRSPAEPEPFLEHFRTNRDVVRFDSLGRDAWLIAPCPGERGTDFAHLASFVRTASPACASALWRAVGDAVAERVGTAPLWLSTAGLGVSWLHVRLDSRPKYYRHRPYTTFAGEEA